MPGAALKARQAGLTLYTRSFGYENRVGPDVHLRGPAEGWWSGGASNLVRFYELGTVLDIH